MSRPAHTSGLRRGCAPEGTENGLSDAHLVWILGVCAERDIIGPPEERIRTLAGV
jgi:hypothetical protein